MPLLLASASPRRAALLAAAGFTFDVVPADVDERRVGGETPEAYVGRVAAEKAHAVACLHPGSVVIGADTVVVVADQVFGKPDGAADATRMLKCLSGASHVVLTGVALYRDGLLTHAVESTRVHFQQLNDSEIAWYVSTGEPFDKAGGYAVQGLASRFIDRIEGSYSNVVGLPVARVHRMLVEAGVIETGDLTRRDNGDNLESTGLPTL